MGVGTPPGHGEEKVLPGRYVLFRMGELCDTWERVSTAHRFLSLLGTGL